MQKYKNIRVELEGVATIDVHGSIVIAMPANWSEDQIEEALYDSHTLGNGCDNWLDENGNYPGEGEDIIVVHHDDADADDPATMVYDPVEECFVVNDFPGTTEAMNDEEEVCGD